MPGPHSLPDNWRPLTPEQGHAFVAQLWRELGPGHFLLGHRVRAIATDAKGSAVVFEVENWEAPLAVVRLSWPRVEAAPFFWPQRHRRGRAAPAVRPLANLAELADPAQKHD